MKGGGEERGRGAGGRNLMIERKQDVAEGAEVGHFRRRHMVELINNQG